MAKSIHPHKAWKFPFQNFSLKDEKEEKWREIEGYDGAYQISNHGRVKSIARIYEFVSNGREIRKRLEGRILKQRVLITENYFSKTTNLTLTITLKNPHLKRGRKENVVARLVYQAFNPKFDLNEKVIYHKDNEPLNNTLDNLVAVSRSERSKMAFEQGRMPHVQDMNKHITSEILHFAARKRFQPVTQYTMNGIIVASYDSISVAAKINSIHTANIRSAIKGKVISAGGYLWRKGRDEAIDIKTIQQRLLTNKMRDCKAITQYDRSGKRVKIFASLADAAREMNGNRSLIRRAMNGKAKTAYNSIWKEGEGPERI